MKPTRHRLYFEYEDVRNEFEKFKKRLISEAERQIDITTIFDGKSSISLDMDEKRTEIFNAIFSRFIGDKEEMNYWHYDEGLGLWYAEFIPKRKVKLDE